jgi:RNA polymerase sigma-70 factor (ECF subfamily)
MIARQMISPGWARAKLGASDLVQETLAVALRQIDRWTNLPDGQRTGWLIVVLQNVAQAKLRDLLRHKRDPRLERSMSQYVDAVSGWFEHEFAGNELPPDQIAEQRELMLRLAVGVAELPPGQRAVFEGREFDGLSYDEIAVALRLTSGQVAGLLRDARRSLRRRLDGEET